jgi:hypothetical protein
MGHFHEVNMITPWPRSRLIEHDKTMSNEEKRWNDAVSGTNRTTAAPDSCVAISPDGRQIQIPKELFLALWDFLEGRKVAGSITLQFRDGTLSSLEAVAKKSFRNV